jgi:hypothetical protein
MEIQTNENINRLLDLYKNLLTTYQQEIMELYFEEDWSLKEIAEQYDISRNAVLSTIKRVSKTLQEYEDRLKLIEKLDNINKLISESSLSEEEKKTLINKIDSII